MHRKLVIAAVTLMVMSVALGAQDAGTVIATTSRTLGADNL